MKLCRFKIKQEIRTGVVDGNTVRLFENNKPESTYHLSDVKLLAPVSPSKIVCVGRNYAEHAAELGNEVPKEPLLFLKAPSALINHGESIKLTPLSHQVEHEGELAVVIGRRCRGLREGDDPMSFVLGYTCLNDVTAR